VSKPRISSTITSLDRILVHGYSLLRTQLNREYFEALFDESLKFGIELEGHREYY
jgi:hypothetical protein